MKNLEIALCDVDSNYILKLASHLMEKYKAGVHIFTTPESLFSDENDYDAAIIAEDFEEVIKFKQKGEIKHKYFLCEEPEDENESYFFKYQSVDKIFEKITVLTAKASIKKSNEKSKLIGIYSPSSHELQLPFAMAMTQSYRTDGRVLFLDLEELSILPELIEQNQDDRNLLDLLYDINTNSQEFDISKYTSSFLGFDYVKPFENPNEISEIDEDTWNLFFNEVAKSNYDFVVILFGRTINGFSRYMENLDKLYVLGRPGDYFRKSQDKFVEYLEKIGCTVDFKEVMLPMSAGNLSDGTYQIEELLQGNLGVFVKKLLNVNGREEIKLCS